MNDLSVSMSAAGGPATSAALPEAPAKVTARGLNFYYGENQALKNINITLGTHRVTAFIGPSGCGKSTLLRIFNRMYDLYPGQRATGQLILDQTNILDPKLDLNLLRARVAGETAPLLFTALSNQIFSLDLTKTMANLPVTINNFVQSPYEYWKQLAWSGALLITLTVLALNIGARILGAERTMK